ncbi:sex peptide receptor-like protein, partial [Leptotrombidium deliense]
MLNSSADLNNGTELDSSPFHDGYGNIFHDFHDFYLPIHGYLSLTVCVFGTITNILNIIVLTSLVNRLIVVFRFLRKEMESATNKILTGLAVADMLVMIDYIPFAIHNFIKTHESEVDKFSLPWTVYTLIHAHVSVVGHTISTWLTVILAVWRYLSVRFPTESRSWLIVSNALWSILVTYILVPIFCIPIYLSFTISEEMLTEESNSTNSSSIFYRVDWSVIAQENNGLLRQINFWVFSVGTKLVPCVLLTYLSSALIRVLMQTEKRKKRLKENCYILAGNKSTNNGLDAATNATSNTELSAAKVNDVSVSKQRSAKDIP